MGRGARLLRAAGGGGVEPAPLSRRVPHARPCLPAAPPRQSAGATAALVHAVHPLSAGLFARVAAESPYPGLALNTAAAAGAAGAQFAAAAGCAAAPPQPPVPGLATGAVADPFGPTTSSSSAASPPPPPALHGLACLRALPLPRLMGLAGAFVPPSSPLPPDLYSAISGFFGAVRWVWPPPLSPLSRATRALWTAARLPSNRLTSAPRPPPPPRARAPPRSGSR